jgi:hypothetical protein
MNTTTSADASHRNALFQATVLTSLFQNMLYGATHEARDSIIRAFLPFHTELGVGEDFLENLLDDLAAGEAGAIDMFAGHIVRSSNAYWCIWRVTYG